MIREHIPLLKPKIFRETYIGNSKDSLLNSGKIDDFFIHSFQKDVVELKLPLPLHKKTVNDFVFILNGEMTKSIGLQTFHLKKNQLLFTPTNTITATEAASHDLEGFYCHFSNDFLAASPFLTLLQSRSVAHHFIAFSKCFPKRIELSINPALPGYFYCRNFCDFQRKHSHSERASDLIQIQFIDYHSF